VRQQRSLWNVVPEQTAEVDLFMLALQLRFEPAAFCCPFLFCTQVIHLAMGQSHRGHPGHLLRRYITLTQYMMQQDEDEVPS